MKLHFYRADSDGATTVDKVIVFGTGGVHSHVEGEFSDGMWFSISPREDMVRFKRIHKEDNHWDTIELPFPDHVECELRWMCEEYPKMRYSYIGAILSITPFCFSLPNRTFCSRLWAELLRGVGFPLGNPCAYSPAELYDALRKLKL